MTAAVKTTEPAEPKGKKEEGGRRSAHAEISLAIDLGWRVAALHGLSPTTLKPPSEINEDMLLNRRSLSAADRLELELHTIDGVARKLGIPLQPGELAALVALAQQAGESPEGEQAFREALALRHTAFDKALWMANEPSGKAYELGNFISDTWNRVARPLVKPDPASELAEVFSPVRVERIKLLLDDLQARVDPIAAHAVNNHLVAWSARLHDTEVVVPGAGLPLDAAIKKLEPVERQTIIWRQMLTGDKEPEAFLSQAKRGEVRDELTKMLWTRYRRWIWLLPIVVAIGLFIGYEYTHNKDLAGVLTGGFFALTGALGLQRAAMLATVKRGVQSWGDLMWDRALAAVICRETSLVHELFPDDELQRGVARLRRG